MSEPVTSEPGQLAATGGAGPAPATRFGVICPGERTWGPEMVNYLDDLGAAWVRVNVFLDGGGPGYTMFLAAGLNVVLNCANRDPANLDTSFGTPGQWPAAGFPFLSRAVYQRRIHDLLLPALPYLAAGRRLWVQCEDEVVDASVRPNAWYWRGTGDDYLTQLDALFEEVHSLSAQIHVVACGFASETLEAAIDPGDPWHDLASAWMTRVLVLGRYDSADLHFYNCPDTVAAKAQWVKSALPPGKVWISTENGGPDFRCPATPLAWEQDPARFEQIQASQVAPRLAACEANGGVVCLYFSLVDLLGEASVFTHLGLLDPTFQPPRKKPAYAAFKSSTGAHQRHPRRRLPPG